MKVKELIATLEKLDPERIVVLAKDQEGNGYEEAHSIQVGAFDSSEGEFGFETLTDKDRRNGYNEEDIIRNGDKAVCIWP